MGIYIQNASINCPYCGNWIREGNESRTPLRGKNKILIECVWRCDKCGMMARRDEKTIDG